MSRWRNCYDNAVAESFFQPIKREHIRRKPISTARWNVEMSSATSRYSTTRNAAMAMPTTFLRKSLKLSTSSSPRVSRNTSVIHVHNRVSRPANSQGAESPIDGARQYGRLDRYKLCIRNERHSRTGLSTPLLRPYRPSGRRKPSEYQYVGSARPKC